MKRGDWLLVLQGLGMALQIVNAQISIVTHDASTALLIGALISGYQFVIQRLGNESIPPRAEAVIEAAAAQGLGEHLK